MAAKEVESPVSLSGQTKVDKSHTLHVKTEFWKSTNSASDLLSTAQDSPLWMRSLVAAHEKGYLPKKNGKNCEHIGDTSICPQEEINIFKYS